MMVEAAPRAALRGASAWVALTLVALGCLACFAARAHAAAGDLDPAFGMGGVALTDFDIDDGAYAVALAPDGKIVVAGTVYNDSGQSNAFVYRLNPDGSPDASFNSDGRATIDSGIQDDGFGVAVQPDGKVVVVGRVRPMAGTDDAVVYRLNSNGFPDLDFDGDGMVRINTGGEESAQALALRPDGKIVVIGDTSNAGNPNDIVVWRLTSTGGLDPTFDADGTATVDAGSGDRAQAVALQPDGKIVVAGTVDYTKMGVYRLTENGAPANTLNDALDPTFSGNGIATVSRGVSAEALALALRPDGKILVAGRTGDSMQSDALVAQLQANGGPGADPNDALDPSFDGDGFAVIDTRAKDVATGLALQPDGRIVLSGTTDTGTASDPVVWRLQPNGGPGPTNGAFDPSFSGDGTALIDRDVNFATMNDVIIQPDRRIVGVGRVFIDAATFRLFGDPFGLTVAKTGKGSVTSAPAGIDCGTVCAYPFDDGTHPTLTATPAPDWRFGGFDGAGCSGKDPCTVTMNADLTVAALFTPAAFGANTLVTVRLAKRRIGAKGPLPVRVSNRNDFTITGKLSGRTVAKVTASRLRRLRVRAKAFTVAAHARKTVKLKLPKALRRLLKSQGKLTLRLTAKVKDPAGHTRSVNKKVTPRLKQ